MTEYFEKDAEYLAFIINGSVARGDEREDSDVDFYLVVADSLFGELSAKNATAMEANEYCVDPCTEANGYLISKTALRAIRDHGNEISKWAFIKTMILFSKDGEIDQLVAEIPKYPEQGRRQRMESYHSQIFYHFSFFEYAYYSQTKYLIYETATKMILAAGRLILADNKILYRTEKDFSRS